MVTLVGAFAGVNVFGIAGLLLGPLVLSYAIELAIPDNGVAVGVSPAVKPEGADTLVVPAGVT
jgi:hypothetical protein